MDRAQASQLGDLGSNPSLAKIDKGMELQIRKKNFHLKYFMQCHLVDTLEANSSG